MSKVVKVKLDEEHDQVVHKFIYTLMNLGMSMNLQPWYEYERDTSGKLIGCSYLYSAKQ